MKSPREELISTSQIAALAAVDVSTVSNWRNRFSNDFPRPKAEGELGKRPKFWHTEVVAWLDRHPEVGGPQRQKEKVGLAALDDLRSYLPAADSVDLLGRLLVAIAERRKAGQKLTEVPASAILEWIGSFENRSSNGARGSFDTARAVPGQVLEGVFARLLEFDDAATVYDSLLNRFIRPADIGENSTPGAIADFMLALVPEKVHEAIDPASGYGELLLRGLLAGVFERGVGVDGNFHNVEIASRRFALHNVNATAVHGDSLVTTPLEDRLFDLVLADVPLNIKIHRQVLANQRWDFGIPSGSSGGDFAWLQRAIGLLSGKGRAIVVTTIGPLFKSDGASTAIRAEMIRRGSIEAIIALPGGMRQSTGIRLAVWVLGRPDESKRNAVLLVDAGEQDGSDAVTHVEIATGVRRWLSSGELLLKSTIAASVPITDLLAPDANLLPNRWTETKADVLDPEQWSSEVSSNYNRARRAVTDLRPLPGIRVKAAGGKHQSIKIGELVEGRAATIVRGRYSERTPDMQSEGYRMLTVKHARVGADLTADVEMVLRSAASDAQLVQPGDILVFPDGDKVRARVWDQEGWILGRFMQALRISGSQWVPEYLAAAIGNPANSRYLAGTALRTHFDLKQFEIIALPLEDQHRVAELDREMRATLQRLKTASAMVDVAREDLITAATSGSVTWSIG